MNTKERTAQLRKRIDYLFDEGNYTEINSVIRELATLGDKTDDIKARLAEADLKASLSVQYYNNAVRLFKKALSPFDIEYKQAEEEIDKALRLNPFCAEYIYLKRSCQSKRPAAIFVDWNEKLSESEKLDRAMRQFAGGRYTPEGHRAYCSIKDYGAARKMCVNYARELLEEHRFDEAEQFFCKGLDFESAEQLVPKKREEFQKEQYKEKAEEMLDRHEYSQAEEYYRLAGVSNGARIVAERKAHWEKICAKSENEQAVYSEFIGEVGDTQTYLSRRIKAEYPEKWAETERARNLLKAYPLGKGRLCTASLLISFILSVVLAFAPESLLILGVFSLCFAVGIIRLRKKRKALSALFFTLLTAALIFAVSSIILTNKNMILDTVPLFQKIPDTLIINLVSFAVCLFVLIKQIKGLPGERAAKQLKALKPFLKEKNDEIKKELYDRYSTMADPKLVTKWISRLGEYGS